MAHRKEEKEARRLEREQKEQERLAAERRKKRIGFGVAGVLVIAAVGAVVFALTSGGGGDVPKAKVKNLAQAAKLAQCKVQSFKSEGRQHVTTTVSDYKTNPPTSGPHNPQPALDGEYDTAPAKEAYVHTLEHGRIELQYKPGSPSNVKDALKAVFDESSEKMMMFPNNTGIEDQVVATAWTHMVSCPKYNSRVPDALRTFRDAYRGKGPENIP
jgi:hypothetical protein